jgi:hypothetical protein
MSGKRLLIAAKTLFKAGEQLNAMVECLEEKVGKALTREPFIAKLDEEEWDVDQNEEDWVTKSYIVNIPLYETKRKKNPYAWIGFMIVIYDEDEIAQVDGWEPALYVMYGPGGKDGGWDVGGFDYKAECRLQEPDGRIWLYKDKDDDKWDSWFFVLPLTALSNEDALQLFVVEPMCKLLKMGLKKLDPSQAFPHNNPVFRFRMGEEKIEIIRP